MLGLIKKTFKVATKVAGVSALANPAGLATMGAAGILKLASKQGRSSLPEAYRNVVQRLRSDRGLLAKLHQQIKKLQAENKTQTANDATQLAKLAELQNQIAELTKQIASCSSGGNGGSNITTPSIGGPNEQFGGGLEKIGQGMDSLDGQINGIINKGDKMTQADQFKLQQLMQKKQDLSQLRSMITSMISNLSKERHEALMAVVRNLR